ncbi:hypothetical protein HNQ56_004811 [Anaerotaenia torta]|uniref:hypothetical protein n=1 Tax=Anaerotaenia torta TaxID=433293 RepID=UPI003D1F210D
MSSHSWTNLLIVDIKKARSLTKLKDGHTRVTTLIPVYLTIHSFASTANGDTLVL